MNLANFHGLLKAHSTFGRVTNQISFERGQAIRNRWAKESMEALAKDNLARSRYLSMWAERIGNPSLV